MSVKLQKLKKRNSNLVAERQERESIAMQDSECQVDEIELLGEPQLDLLGLKEVELSQASKQIEDLKA